MDLKDVIVDDTEKGIFRVHRSTMTSPEIFQLERERIFDKCWLYVGHESEVEHPGDFRRRFVGGQPIFFVKGSDGRIRTFLNTCTHRGAVICRQDEGHLDVFQCFYHCWSFNNMGELVGLPGEDGYAEGFDRAERALIQPPRQDSYRGFHFISYNPDVEDLLSYLAGAREYLDLVDDLGLGQGLKVVSGSNQYAMKANWKLLVENSLDGYHVPVHLTYAQYRTAVMGDREKMWSTSQDMSNQGQRAQGQLGTGGGPRVLGNGHTVTSGGELAGPLPKFARWDYNFTDEERIDVHNRLVERHGEAWATRLSGGGRNLAIYPNLIVNDVMGLTVRVINPISPDYMEISAWCLVPKWAPPELEAKFIYSYNSFLGAGGFGTPDDMEALESCQIGFIAKRAEWNDISRGMHRQAIWNDELQMRGWWRQWHAMIQGQPKADRWDDIRPRQLQAAG